MKKMMATLAVFSTSAVFAQTAAPTLEQRVDNLESLSYLEAIQWSGQFTYRYDGVESKTVSGSTTTERTYNPMRLGILLDANTKAEEGSRVQFFSRFGLTKFVNDFQNQATLGDDTFQGSKTEKSGFLRLDRAFVNYNVGGGVVLTAGRLPTIDGNPVEMWDGAPRLGTYPMLAYGAILDGVAATYNMGFMPEGYKLSARLIYTPFYTVNNGSNTIVGGQITDPTYSAGGTKAISEEATVYTAMLDFETKAIKPLGLFSFIGQVVKGNNIDVVDGVPRGTSLGTVLKSPSLGGNGTSVGSNATGLGCNADGTGSPCANTFAGSTVNFDLNYMTLNTSMNNIADTGLSLGLTYLSTQIDSRGYLESSSALRTIVANYSSVSTDILNLSRALGIGKGVMTDEASKRVEGEILLATLTYKLPVSVLKNPIFGAEFLKGSKNSLFWGYTSDSLTSFYQTRGDAFHVFWTQPLESGLSLRVGYQSQDHDWSKGYLGSPYALDLKETTTYANLKYTF